MPAVHLIALGIYSCGALAAVPDVVVVVVRNRFSLTPTFVLAVF